jgi:hypothetical protein
MSNNKCFCLMNLSYLYVFIFYSVFFVDFFFRPYPFDVVKQSLCLMHISNMCHLLRTCTNRWSMPLFSGMCRTQRQIDIQREIEKILLCQCKHLSKRIKMHLFDSYFFLFLSIGRETYLYT